MVQGMSVSNYRRHTGDCGGGDMDIGVGDKKRNDEDAATKKMDIKSTPSLIVFRRQTYCEVFILTCPLYAFVLEEVIVRSRSTQTKTEGWITHHIINLHP